MSFAIYVAGILAFVGGLIYGAVLLQVPGRWIAVGAIILVALAVLTGFMATRQRDSWG